MAILRTIYFLIFFAQFNANATHLDTDHAFVSSTESCFCRDSLSSSEKSSENANDFVHHCCIMCHVHHIAIITKSNLIPAIFNTHQLTYDFANTYFSLSLFSVFRPPIA